MKTKFAPRFVPMFVLFSFWLMAFIFSPAESWSQNKPSLFVVADFMKVQPDKHSEYLEVEQKIWKPLHEERIRQGTIVGWYLYAVEFAGALDQYNYVVITLYDNAGKLEKPWNAEIIEKVHKGMRPDEIMKRTSHSREHAKSELFYNVATAPEKPMENPATYMQVSYMKVEPGMQSEYEKLESGIWLPIHNEAIKTGQTKGWGLWSSLFPRGADRPYQYITLNAFSEYNYVFEHDFSRAFKNIHPDKDFTSIQEKTQKTRIVARTELWDLIDYAIK
ncbi:MAG: hypothetical protein ACSLE0_00710 [Chitinophagaceae bacterium]